MSAPRVWIGQIIRLLVAGWAFTLLATSPTIAHEIRPAYLELREEQPGEYAVLWKVPMRGELRLALKPRFSGEARSSPSVTRAASGAAIETWILHAPALRGQTLTIEGLEATMTDTLARVEYLDGTSWTARFSPRGPWAIIPAANTAVSVAQLYVVLGIEHILLGIDHLLFVLALLILSRGVWQLVKTITAFTAAHSITLALAALGFVHVPQAPIEAAIALSIVFVAVEIVRRYQGCEGVAARAPWIVAFGFGLLHGFGFAGALSETGLPETHVPLALLFFNLGVEAGQLAFVAAILALIALSQKLRFSLPDWAPRVPAYGIGSIAMFWTIERVASF